MMSDEARANLPALLACPHCDGPGEYRIDVWGGRKRYRTVCGNLECEVGFKFFDPQNAADEWNRRPPTIPADVGRRAMEALQSCSVGGYRDIDGDWIEKRWHDAEKVAASITELQQALAAPSGGQRE